MASNIDPSNIDENFPISGIDNDSQGFRDNFTFIKNALTTAKAEISALENTVNTESLQNLLNISLTDIQPDDVLKWNGTEWVNGAAPNADLVGVLDDLSDVALNNPENNQVLKYDINTGKWTNAASFTTTDDIPEGTTNFYLTSDRFRNYFDDAYSEATGDVLVADYIDSIETTAERVQPGLSNSIRLLNTELIDSFSVGDNVRIFRATSDPQFLTTSAIINSVEKIGFPGIITDPYTFSYKVCQFNKTTGKISPAGQEFSVNGIDITNFNLANNIILSISRTNQENGVLIYRKLTGTSETPTFNLIAILGDKEFENSLSFTYVDYFSFNSTVWSGKDLVRNEYISSTGMVHFPLIAPPFPLYGWIDTTIASIDKLIFRITFTSNYYFESNLVISKDDTALLQNEINAKTDSGINNLILGSKTYIVSKLNIPNGFKLIGKGNKSKLRKLSWSSNLSNNVLSGATNSQINISSLSIDGNMQNQYLLNDDIDISVNYIVNLSGNKNEISYVAIDNVIGGGINCEGSKECFITLSRITNSGLTDIFEYSPVQARTAEEITIVNNFMKNFPGPVDVSVCNIGVLNGNTVNNCGGGILSFGATNFITSPNLILGPAGEYIQGPNIFNSDYDSINIKLEPNTTYTSDVYVYQENGENFNLRSNRASITYIINKLSLVNNVEEIGEEILINGNKPINPIIEADYNDQLANGSFKFSISQNSVNFITTTHSFSNEKLTNSNHIGLIYRVLLTEYVPSGNVLNISTISPKITINPDNSFIYDVVVDGLKNISVDSKIRFLNHGGSPDFNNTLGTVESITTYQNDLKLVKIQYPAPQVGITLAVGSQGEITVENTFIIAKGRIL